jgi:hypothetical protein
MHIECAAQTRKDLRDRAITRFYSDGLRAAANMHFRECRRRCSCQGAADQDRSQDTQIGRTDNAYRDDCEAGQFCSPAGAGDPVAGVTVYPTTVPALRIFLTQTITRYDVYEEHERSDGRTAPPNAALLRSNDAKRQSRLRLDHLIQLWRVMACCWHREARPSTAPRRRRATTARETGRRHHQGEGRRPASACAGCRPIGRRP